MPVDKDWAKLYFGRTKLSREALDSAVKVSNSDENQLRSILGLSLRGSDVTTDVAIWLHQMDVADAIELGRGTYEGVGCSAKQ